MHVKYGNRQSTIYRLGNITQNNWLARLRLSCPFACERPKFPGLRPTNEADKEHVLSRSKADFEHHLRLRARVAGRRVRDPRKVPHEGLLLGKLELEPGEEQAEHDL